MKVQPYFESGFPYGHDQWIWHAGTAWATMGLATAALDEPAGKSATSGRGVEDAPLQARAMTRPVPARSAEQEVSEMIDALAVATRAGDKAAVSKLIADDLRRIDIPTGALQKGPNVWLCWSRAAARPAYATAM